MRVLHELLDRAVIALGVGVLQEMQSDQKPDRQRRPPRRLGIERTELPLENQPVDLVGKLEERVRDEDGVEPGAEHAGLVPGVRGLFGRHDFTGIWGNVALRQLSHKSYAMKSFYIRYVIDSSGTTNYSILFRWYLDLDLDDRVRGHSTFSQKQERLVRSEIPARFTSRILSQAREAGLLSEEHFTSRSTERLSRRGRRSRAFE